MAAASPSRDQINTSSASPAASPNNRTDGGEGNGLTDSAEDNEVALRSMIQQIAQGHVHLTEAVVGDGIQYDVTSLPLTSEQRNTYGWSPQDLANNEKFQQKATVELKTISTWKDIDISNTSSNAAPQEPSKDLSEYWNKYLSSAEENVNEAAQVVQEFATVSALVGNIAARQGLEEQTKIDASKKTEEDLILRTAPFVPNSLYRMQDDAQILRCGAFKLKPNDGIFRTTNSLKSNLERVATKAVHRNIRPTGAAHDQFITFMPIDGKSVALNSHTCVDLDDLLVIHLWKNKQEGLRFQLSMLTISNSFTQHGLGLGVFSAPLCVSVRHLCHYFTVMWLVPIVSKAPLSPAPPITAAVLNLVRKRCGAEGALLDVFMGVDGRRYVLPPNGTYLPLTSDNQTTDNSPRSPKAGESSSAIRPKHRRPEAVLRNKPSEDPDNQVNTDAGRQMAVLKKIIGLTRAVGYTINSASCLDGVHHEFAAEGVCMRDLRAVFYSESSWAGVTKDLKRVMMMRALGAMQMDLQLGIRLAKLQGEVRQLIFAQVVGRTLKALIEAIILNTPSDQQISLVNALITRPLLAIIEKKASALAAIDLPKKGKGKEEDPTRIESYGPLSDAVGGLAKAVNEAVQYKYPIPTGITSAEAEDVRFNILDEPVPVLLAGLQMACRKLFLTLNLGDRKSITSMSSRPVMIAAAVTSPPLILEKDAPIAKRVSALEARFGMVDLVPPDQPVMRFLTLQRACFALGVLMKSAVGCSPEDKALIQDLVEDVLPTMIRGEEESHDVTTIPYVTSMFPFAVAANVTFAALNAVNTVLVSISRLYPDYSAIPNAERTVILSILKQLLLEIKRPEPKRRIKKPKKQHHKSKHHKGQHDELKLDGAMDNKQEGKNVSRPVSVTKRRTEEGNASPTDAPIGDADGKVSPSSSMKIKRKKDTSGQVSRTTSKQDGSASPQTGGLLTAANVANGDASDGRVSRTASRNSRASSAGSGSEESAEEDAEVDEDGNNSKMAIDGDFAPSKKGLQLTDEQKAALAAARAEEERKAAAKLKELLNKAQALDESRPSYIARLAAKNAIALAGVESLYFGFDEEPSSGNDDLTDFLANYAKNAANVAAADAAMNANNAIGTIATANAEKVGVSESANNASPQFDSGGGIADFGFGTLQQSFVIAPDAKGLGVSFAGPGSFAGPTNGTFANKSMVANKSMMAKKSFAQSMRQKASQLEEEDMSYLVDEDGTGAGDEKPAGGAEEATLTLNDVAAKFGLNPKEIHKNNSFVITSLTAPIPSSQTLSLPPHGKAEVIEAAAARLGLNAAALLKHNPSFKPKDTVPATHSLTVPLPIGANLATAAPATGKDKGGKAKTETPATSGGPTLLEIAAKFGVDAGDLRKTNPSVPSVTSSIPSAQPISMPPYGKPETVESAAARLGLNVQSILKQNLSLKTSSDIIPAAYALVVPLPTGTNVAEMTLLDVATKLGVDAKDLLRVNPTIQSLMAAVPVTKTLSVPPFGKPLTVDSAASHLGLNAAAIIKHNPTLKTQSDVIPAHVSLIVPFPVSGNLAEMNLQEIASKFGVDLKELQKSNPSVIGTSLPISGSQALTLPPTGKSETVEAAAARLHLSTAAILKQNPRLRGADDVIPPTQGLIVPMPISSNLADLTLQKVADRFNIKAKDLHKANPFVASTTAPIPNFQTLSLPPSGKAESVESVAARLGLKPSSILKLNPILKGVSDDIPPTHSLTVPMPIGSHLTELSLSEAAAKLGIEAKDLQKANPSLSSGNMISGSQTLHLPPYGKPEIVESAATRLNVKPQAILEHNPTFKQTTDIIPPSYSLVVPMPIGGNLIPESSSQPNNKRSFVSVAPAAAVPIASTSSPVHGNFSEPDYTLSKAAKKFNLDAKAILKANPDIEGVKSLIHRERIIALPAQVVSMTVKEAAAQLGVTAQLLFECNSTSLRLKSLTSEISDGASLVVPAAGEPYVGMSEQVEEYLRQQGKKPATEGFSGADDEVQIKPKKEKRNKQEEDEEMSAMEREINGKRKEKKEKKDKKDKEDKKEKKSKKEKSEEPEEVKFERAMNNPIIRRLSTAYGYDPLELLKVNPHLHDATETTPVSGMISLPPRSEPESVASAADRLGLTPRDLLLLNPSLELQGEIPLHFNLSVPAKPPSVGTNSGSGSFALNPSEVRLSDGQKFDKRLRPDQSGGMVLNIAVNTGTRNTAGLDRAAALLNRASSLAKSPSVIASGSGTFGSPLAGLPGKPQQLRSLNASPTGLGGSPTLDSSNSSKTPLRHPSMIGMSTASPLGGSNASSISSRILGPLDNTPNSSLMSPPGSLVNKGRLGSLAPLPTATMGRK